MVARTSMGKLWSLKDKTNLAFPSNFKGDLAILRAACDVENYLIPVRWIKSFDTREGVGSVSITILQV